MHRRLVSRLIGGVAAATLALACLTGCSDGLFGGCNPEASAGDASDAVTASSAFGVAPVVKFPTPLHVSTTQVSTLIAGHGDPIEADQQVVFDTVLVDGTSGKPVSATKFTGTKNAAIVLVSKTGSKGLTKAFVCARPGERFAAVLPPSEAFPSAQITGVAKSDTIVAIVDVHTAYLAKANGTNQVMAGGLPSVVLAPSGQPGITIPAGEAPPVKLEVDNLKVGSGAVVHAGDKAVVQYTGVLWADGTVFDSSWTAGNGPVPLTVKSGSIVKGLVTALTGQRVGSQVLAVLPPSEAYGKAGSGSTIPAGATLVFVVDILGKV